MDLTDLLRQPARWTSVLRWATLCGLELGVIGPFGSYKANFFNRVVYWTVLFWVGSLVLWPTVVAAMALGPRRGLPPLFSGIATLLVACAPLAAVAAGGCYLLWPVHASGIRPFEWYGLTTVVVLPCMAGLLWLELAPSPFKALQHRSALTTDPTLASLPTAAESFAARGASSEPVRVAGLPDHLLATALCLQMEDHHVRVHIQGRSLLHFASMSRVVAQMAGRPGLQVHRSWWVARDGVTGWHDEGRAVTLVLVNGLRVPVARSRVAVLRDQGWLANDLKCASLQV